MRGLRVAVGVAAVLLATSAGAQPQPAKSKGVFDNFVFRPGGVQGGNVYTDWSDLVAATSLVQGYKTIQFDNSIAGVCEIPVGVWDMTDVEWTGLTTSAANPNPVQIVMNEGVQFTNLLAFGGQIVINNFATATPVNVIPASGATVEFGFGPAGDNPVLNNFGTAPFWDASSGGVLITRQSGTIQGANPAINLGGAGFYVAGMGLVSTMAANMIVGTNPLATCLVVYGGPSSQFNQQPGFAGTVVQNVLSYVRHSVRPVPPAAPSAVALTGSNLAVNTTHLLDPGAVADLAQPLPLVRNLAVPTGSNSGVPGSLLSTGVWATFVNTTDPALRRAKDIVLSPSIITEKINGVAGGTLVVPPGGSRTLMSDGVDNWWVIAGYR